MVTQKYIEHSEWSGKYPAIDGIPKPTEERTEKAIRSDIEAIINLSEDDFNDWYNHRKDKTRVLFDMYKSFAEIPDLSLGSEFDKCMMGDKYRIREHIGFLEMGLDYLEKIKQVREEMKKKLKF